MNTLKPCPFCGATTETNIPGLGKTPAVGLHSYPKCFRVECESCGCVGPIDIKHQLAIKSWNTRKDRKK